MNKTPDYFSEDTSFTNATPAAQAPLLTPAQIEAMKQPVHEFVQVLSDPGLVLMIDRRMFEPPKMVFPDDVTDYLSTLLIEMRGLEMLEKSVFENSVTEWFVAYTAAGAAALAEAHDRQQGMSEEDIAHRDYDFRKVPDDRVLTNLETGEKHTAKEWAMMSRSGFLMTTEY